MRILSLVILFLGFFLVESCGSTSEASKLFSIELEGNQKKIQNGNRIGIAIKNKKDKVIDKIEYSLDGQPLDLEDGKVILESDRLGEKSLKATIHYDETTVQVSKKIVLLAENVPAVYTYEIVNEYPHDRNAFTQGLEFRGDTLYESTGLLGKSTLRQVDYSSGEVLKKVDLGTNEFGEGLTVINDQVAQLTWQKGMGYVYDAKTLEQTGTFSYGKSKEGWGLCNDGQKIYKSDGTDKIWILNPKTFAEEGYIQTVTNKSVFNKANELEFVDGKIFANVWQKESMMIIDAASGAIEGVINFGGLKSKVDQHSELDVLNGVAYHKERGTFFVTGKNWSKLFEVNIIKKD